jgi:hypothetical protein
MLATTHVAVGALVASTMPSTVLGGVAGFLVGLGTHLALDTVPHWGSDDPDSFLRVAKVDGITLLVVGILISVAFYTSGGRSAAAVGVATMFGALLFDLDKPFRHFFGIEIWPAKMSWFLGRIQFERTYLWPVDCLTASVALILVCSILL